ncbi:UDP-N-acetylglucosamine 1-carboxyvinyltransferase [Candidatus Peregrinibacteria bacterium]|nr:UDP-N-acetylglucosamine 1-carboxyvinyltransferase [Candidatus Peregrinibacteria bacterium]
MTDPKTTQKFIIEGGSKLAGKITVSGSKNATLPIMCATLLVKGKTTLKNVPDIADIHKLIKIFEALNVKVDFNNNTAIIDASDLSLHNLPNELICNMRGSILLFGPILSRIGELKIPFPGGCVIGKRSVQAHTHALQSLGAVVMEDDQNLHLKMEKPRSGVVIMPEISVTGTENAVMLAAMTPGNTQIRLAAAEPHVQDLCHFLNATGAKIKGIGTHFLDIEGVKELNPVTHSITGDYLEAGTFAIASLVTQSELIIDGIETNQLDSFWQKLDEAGAKYELAKNEARILPSLKLKAIKNLRTSVYPSFATDLQAPFAVLLTQAEGESNIFETLFEGRLNYLFELEQMGAKMKILNPHQATVYGPSRLKGCAISSLDLRAGAAMVLAALCAEGKSEVSNINYIDRGYEQFENKLQSIGAKIERISVN